MQHGKKEGRPGGTYAQDPTTKNFERLPKRTTPLTEAS